MAAREELVAHYLGQLGSFPSGGDANAFHPSYPPSYHQGAHLNAWDAEAFGRPSAHFTVPGQAMASAVNMSRWPQNMDDSHEEGTDHGSYDPYAVHLDRHAPNAQPNRSWDAQMDPYSGMSSFNADAEQFIPSAALSDDVSLEQSWLQTLQLQQQVQELQQQLQQGQVQLSQHHFPEQHLNMQMLQQMKQLQQLQQLQHPQQQQQQQQWAPPDAKDAISTPSPVYRSQAGAVVSQPEAMLLENSAPQLGMPLHKVPQEEVSLTSLRHDVEEDETEAEDNDSEHEQDSEVTKDISSAVAAFLSGHLDDEDDNESDLAEELIDAVAPEPYGEDDFCEDSAEQRASTTHVPQNFGYDTAAKPSNAIYSYDLGIPRVVRGRTLSKSLLDLPLPPGIKETQLPQLRRILSAILLELQKSGQRSSIDAVQDRLRKQGINDIIVESILVFCARDPSSFVISMEVDTSVSVFLAGTEVEPDDDEWQKSSYQGEYSTEFLEALVDIINKQIKNAQQEPNTEIGGLSMQQMPQQMSHAPASIAAPGLQQPSMQQASMPMQPAAQQPAMQPPVVPLADLVTPPGVMMQAPPSFGMSEAQQMQVGGIAPPGVFSGAGGGDGGNYPVPVGLLGHVGDGQDDSIVPGLVAMPETVMQSAFTVPSDNLPKNSAELAAAQAAATVTPTAAQLGKALEQQQVQTVMVRNIPQSVTQKRLIEELQSSGFDGMFDFCYMPSMFGTGVGKGYAFVNLISPKYVANFVAAWHGSRRFGIANGEAALNVSAAALQGREQNAKKWDAPRMRRVRNPALRPLVLDQSKTSYDPVPVPTKTKGKDDPTFLESASGVLGDQEVSSGAEEVAVQ